MHPSAQPGVQPESTEPLTATVTLTSLTLSTALAALIWVATDDKTSPRESAACATAGLEIMRQLDAPVGEMAAVHSLFGV